MSISTCFSPLALLPLASTTRTVQFSTTTGGGGEAEVQELVAGKTIGADCTPMTSAPPTGALDALAVPSSRKKRRKERPKAIVPTPTERLVSFMDKLSTPQTFNKARDQRDWLRCFCEDAQSPSSSSARLTHTVHSGTSHLKRAASVQSTTADSDSQARPRSLFLTCSRRLQRGTNASTLPTVRINGTSHHDGLLVVKRDSQEQTVICNPEVTGSSVYPTPFIPAKRERNVRALNALSGTLINELLAALNDKVPELVTSAYTI
ncbi:hypothetical protein F5I97DRAFT_1833255 [Phlebopus sp. FC_14]|nr:hypothetical protein F5I97DRAFT_1833255 [Phlebopus sp. FC_14]